MRQPFRYLFILPALFAAIAMSNSKAHAVPFLQLYIEGATYDSSGGEETWVFDLSGGSSFRLWAIGNVAGPGGAGSIFDVKLSAVYDTSIGDLEIFLTPSTTSGFNGFTDPSTPGIPVNNGTNIGGLPKLGDGSDLPSHGEYDKNGTTRTWQEFLLGDFDLTDSPIEDFITTVPTATSSNQGQINVYDVSIALAAGNTFSGPLSVHFDLYNHYFSEVNGNAKFVNAPFSHDSASDGGDADATPGIVPEPSSLALFGIGAIGLAVFAGRRRRKKA